MLTIRKPAVPTRAGVALGIALVTSLALSGTQMQARVRLAPATEASVSPRPPDRKAAGPDGELTFPLGTVIQGADTVDLIATLPWWRAPLGPGAHPGRDESQVLTACDSWLGFPFANGESDSLTVRLALTQQVSAIESAINRIPVADPNELNEIDLAAGPAPQPGRSWWLGALLAVLGLAVATRAEEARLIIRRLRWARALSASIESESALVLKKCLHFLRKTGVHFSGKCSSLGLVLERTRYFSLYLPGRPIDRFFVAIGWPSVAPLKRWLHSLLREFSKPLPETGLGPRINDWVACLGVVRARTVRCFFPAPTRLSSSWRG